MNPSINILDNYKDNLSNCPNDDCGAGINNFGTTARYDNNDDSAIVCTCPKCNHTWYLCRYCTGNYMYVLRTKELVRNHIKRHHKDRLLPTPDGHSHKKRKARATKSCPPPLIQPTIPPPNISIPQQSTIEDFILPDVDDNNFFEMKTSYAT